VGTSSKSSIKNRAVRRGTRVAKVWGRQCAREKIEYGQYVIINAVFVFVFVVGFVKPLHAIPVDPANDVG
jgi:hypothetical protein